MSLEVAFVKSITGNVSVVDGITDIQRDIKAGDELFLNDTITPVDATSSIVIAINGREDITLNSNESLFLDKSVIDIQSFSDEAVVSSGSVEEFVATLNVDFETNILFESDDLDFSNEHLFGQEVEHNPTSSLNINDIIEMPNAETKIFHDDTQEVSLNQVDWIKQDDKVFEDGHSFDVYTKDIGGHEVTTLWIEDDISVFYNHS
ncbi:hypothetical protein [Sulfurospirillum arcachonense]|uniref:hypothetical protein n=1 Tax=Sulfurospirillum arcachonense TaxID=57666 RepID=UPI00046950A5|nr:hypothetical protein [Sulfurospirillum arcachonense]